MQKILIFGWVMAVLAVSALIYLVVYALSIGDALERRNALYTDSIQYSIAAEETARHRAVFASTIAERNSLAVTTKSELLQMVGAIERAGRDAGITLTLSAASKVDLGQVRLLQPVDFVVEAKGSFARVYRALELLEQLPLPSRIVQVTMQLESEPSKEEAEVWRGMVRVRMFTSSPL